MRRESFGCLAQPAKFAMCAAKQVERGRIEAGTSKTLLKEHAGDNDYELITPRG